MKRYLSTILTSILCLISFTGCNDDENDYPDIKLIHGEWEVVSDDSPNLGAIYNFIPKSELTDSWGTLIIQYPSHSDQSAEETSYSWAASNPVNDGGVINLEITPLDSENPDGNIESVEYYEVKKLDKKNLWLQQNNVSSPTVIKFMRK